MIQSATAEYMALFRALETALPEGERLFSDPYASRFLARPSLRAVARLARIATGRRRLVGAIDRIWPGARPSGVARTRLIDDELSHSLRTGIDQVVTLGAGFDCRAHRLTIPAAVRFFEVDRPETLDRKRSSLGEAPSTKACGVIYVPCDFEESRLSGCLARAGFDPGQRSFFLWEGVTNYLTAEAVDRVLQLVRFAAPGSRLLFTYIDRMVLEDPGRFAGARRLRRTLSRAREPWTFGLDPAEVGSFLRERGLRLLSDTGSVEYRSRYLGPRGRHLEGYEFYRAALAVVEGGV